MCSGALIYIYYIYGTSSPSQASQDEPAACDFDKPEGGENQMITSAGNTPDTEEQHDNSNVNNFATYRRERLEGQFGNSNIINIINIMKLKSPSCLRV